MFFFASTNTHDKHGVKVSSVAIFEVIARQVHLSDGGVVLHQVTHGLGAFWAQPVLWQILRRFTRKCIYANDRCSCVWGKTFWVTHVSRQSQRVSTTPFVLTSSVMYRFSLSVLHSHWQPPASIAFPSKSRASIFVLLCREYLENVVPAGKEQNRLQNGWNVWRSHWHASF